MTDFEGLLGALVGREVEFILVGGLAARAHGSARSTQDVDVVYGRSDENIERVVAALAPLEPSLRGAPPGLPFALDVVTVARGLNFTLTTTRGAIDLLGEITGGAPLGRPHAPRFQVRRAGALTVRGTPPCHRPHR